MDVLDDARQRGARRDQAGTDGALAGQDGGTTVGDV
jgi:hypothetical protein